MALQQIGFASPVMAMEAFFERHQAWIEASVGCPAEEMLTLEFEFPVSHLVLEQMLSDVVLDRQCLAAADSLRPLIRRWRTPPGCSPRVQLVASRDRLASITERKLGWDPHWKETPIAVWLHGTEHAVVTANVPYVSYLDKGAMSWRQWTIVNRRDAAFCLNVFRTIESIRKITVVGGTDIPLPENGYDWDSLVLDPILNETVRQDFETFWQSEGWFSSRRMPYQRGFLLYGPPGNGKTSVARIMACYPQITALSIDLKERLPNEALTDLFQTAADRAPSLIIIEDLDRMFGSGMQTSGSEITLSHFLNCLDGPALKNGIVIVSTANDPMALDPAILRRPGRFDRLVPFPLPSVQLRRRYVHSLTRGTLDDASIVRVSKEADRLSFAQLREAYILAGQRTFRQGDEIGTEELVQAVRTIRAEIAGLTSHRDYHPVGFSSADAQRSS